MHRRSFARYVVADLEAQKPVKLCRTLHAPDMSHCHDRIDGALSVTTAGCTVAWLIVHSLRTLRRSYTRLRLGGLQPLCGIGVTSRIIRTSIPAAARARIADSRPEPGPLTRTSTARRPWSRAWLAAFIAACCAANGVPFREPRKPSEPELFHDTTLPSLSVMVMMVLLNEA